MILVWLYESFKLFRKGNFALIEHLKYKIFKIITFLLFYLKLSPNQRNLTDIEVVI